MLHQWYNGPHFLFLDKCFFLSDKGTRIGQTSHWDESSTETVSTKETVQNVVTNNKDRRRLFGRFVETGDFRHSLKSAYRLKIAHFFTFFIDFFLVHPLKDDILVRKFEVFMIGRFSLFNVFQHTVFNWLILDCVNKLGPDWCAEAEIHCLRYDGMIQMGLLFRFSMSSSNWSPHWYSTIQDCIFSSMCSWSTSKNHSIVILIRFHRLCLVIRVSQIELFRQQELRKNIKFFWQYKLWNVSFIKSKFDPWFSNIFYPMKERHLTRVASGNHHLQPWWGPIQTHRSL